MTNEEIERLLGQEKGDLIRHAENIGIDEAIRTLEMFRVTKQEDKRQSRINYEHK